MLRTTLIVFSFFVIASISVLGFKGWVHKPNVTYTSADRILIAAHRGLHKQYPENSVPSIMLGIDKGIDIIEIDVRETRDHIPVLMHDKSLNRTTGVNRKLTELNYDQLQKLRLYHHNKATEYKVPSLEEVLLLAKDSIILNIDFKLTDLPSIKRTYDLIAKHQMEKQVLFTLKDLDLIPQLQAYNNKISIMPVVYTNSKINEALDYDHLQVLQLYHSTYSEHTLQRIRRKKMQIWVNSMKKYDKLEMKGKKGFEKLIAIKKIDMIQTDHPEALLKFLQEKGLHD